MRMKFRSALAVFSSIYFVSCGINSNSLFSASDNLSCSMSLNTSSWQQAYSPNINIFPPTYNYAAVSASTSNCTSVFSDTKDITVSLNLSSNVNGYTGQQLVFAAIYGGSRTFVANDFSYNFYSGNLNGTIIDSSANSSWRPPFADPGTFTLVFQIPPPILGQTSNYPAGNVTLTQK